MQFDLFHSIGRIDLLKPIPADRAIFSAFIEQCCLGEDLGYSTMWVAESHFSSEIQKSNARPVIPHYRGEVGLNADSFQLSQLLFAKTRTIGFGTAIHNIVGGNGGPIASADRVRTLAFLNSMNSSPRKLHIGVASGRFPYINAPFGIVPRSELEKILWPQYQRLIFIEALEIFLRLSRSEALASSQIKQWRIDRSLFRSDEEFAAAMTASGSSADGVAYQPRWDFERLMLVPEMREQDYASWMNFVLGSHDPMARDHGLKFADLDIFNLSFTPPSQLAKVHEEMFVRYRESGRLWHRSRMPRTVLVFIDQISARAREMASRCFDVYIEAMRGTVVLPPKDELMARALIGDPSELRDQLSHDNPNGFHHDDRLMLWFEFNQNDHEAIKTQMRLFAEKVMPFVGGAFAGGDV
jgi:alkanesulfonate monooxygenase SsuD/methylene tetrahydromethanopterin reductase-like flavin-dependent oxidoreductase (luciferase family)